MIVSTKKKQTTLTEKEIKILVLVANGHKYKDIANEIKTNESDVKNNMAKMTKELKASNNVDCVIKGIENELLEIKSRRNNKQNKTNGKSKKGE
jgi:DNA-binding NarL/FixJ family response regulator